MTSVTYSFEGPSEDTRPADRPQAATLRDTTRPSQPSGTRVTVRSLTKIFGSRTVLDDIDFDLAPGEFVAIVGRSGCGKSTLLRLLAGLERAEAGRIEFDGRPFRPADAADSGLRLMFQDARLLPWKRVIDNVALGLEGRDARRRAEEALREVGLAERAHEWPAVLSGGQRQRVALARALVHRPHLLLLDEPLGALDALTRIEMQSLIERLWREHGFSAVLVTHDVSEAVALADRVVLIEDHRIALDEPVPLARPRSRGQAAFASFEERVLQRVLSHGADAQQGPDTVPGHWIAPTPAHAVNWAI